MKKEFIVEGLHCANCATKIENGLKKVDGVCDVQLNFATQSLMIETDQANHFERIIGESGDLIQKIEPGVRIREKKKGLQDHGHHHDHDEDHDEHGSRMQIFQIGIGAILFLAALFMEFPWEVELVVYLAGYLFVGGKVILRALRNITRGQVFDENFLMGLATVGAFVIGEYPEAVAVMLFYQIGEFFQDRAVMKSRKSISALMDFRPDFANVKKGDKIEKVSPDIVEIGEIIVVKPGEKVPLDGVVIEGTSMLDTSALTGESVPRSIGVGNGILSGSVNLNGLLMIEVTKEFGDSTVSKILDLVQNASNKKAATENFITKFAKIYTPVVVIAAVILAFLPPLILPGASLSEWIHRSLVFLVVSCPCALVISIPLGFFGGIGAASKNGILIKGSNILEALNQVDTVVFDKTGTLTKGIFEVTKIHSTESVSEEVVLELAAYAESYSNHPIAVSIRKAFQKEIDQSLVTGTEEVPGHGIKAIVKGKQIIAGNVKLLGLEGIEFKEEDTLGTAVYIAIDGQYAGAIIISDEMKEDSHDAILTLKSMGVQKTVLLTGDHKHVGEEIGKTLGIDEVYAELLPQQKVDQLEMLLDSSVKKRKVIFVGDGMNDAPVLARADIGVAMGGVGSDAAIEAADVVLMKDEPMGLVKAILIAKKTRSIIWQNIFFTMFVKGIVLILGAGGLATIWEAVFADVGVALIAVLNAMRIIKGSSERAL